MSTMVHCDGPNCDEAKDESLTAFSFGRGWYSVTIRFNDVSLPTCDFCSSDCLAEWAAQQ